MLPLMKYAFVNELDTKKRLSEFILSAQKLSMGEECEKFEQKFASFQGSKYAILFNSGGSANLALMQALKNLGYLKDGDKVGFSALTWSTNVMPIIQLGLIPVAIDCDEKTLNVMSYNLEERLQETDIKALFITNALGFAGDLDKISEICKNKNIILLEDNCEALGTEIDDKKTGAFGIGATFSFFVAHHMSTIEGGMICTEDDELCEMLKIVRANGWDRNLTALQQHRIRSKHNIDSEFMAKYTFYDLGYNLRPTEITGFLGQIQLEYIEKAIEVRERNFIELDSLVKENDELISVEYSHLSKISNFAFPLIAKTIELKQKYFNRFSGNGIEIRPMISGNIQNQPFYHKYVDEHYTLLGTEMIDKCGFYCGNYLELTQNDLELIKSCLIK